LDNDYDVSYNGIAKYYDNRQCAVTISLDEWDDCNTPYDYGFVYQYGQGARTICDILNSRSLWATIAIVTRGRSFGGEPTWADIQTKINNGFLEYPVMVNRIHIHHIQVMIMKLVVLKQTLQQILLLVIHKERVQLNMLHIGRNLMVILIHLRVKLLPIINIWEIEQP
jgi:hypothetical protein